MNTTTLIVIVVAVAVAVFSLWLIFFSGKKKKKEKDKPQKSIEPVVKPSEKKEAPATDEQPKVTMPDFKVIRKKSQVKVNKKALKGGSRNPSITKVFVNGKNVDEEEERDAVKAPEVEPIAPQEPEPKDVGRFGARDPVFKEHGDEVGLPNRSPRLQDRTNFASHLVISDDNNLSGVSGTGIAKAVEKSEGYGKDIDSDTERMVQSVRENMLGDQPVFTDPFDFLQSEDRQAKPKSSPKDKLKNIDAKTLIIADALANRKGKK